MITYTVLEKEMNKGRLYLNHGATIAATVYNWQQGMSWDDAMLNGE